MSNNECNIKEAVGKKIRKIRQRKKWSIEELSFRAELNKNYLGDVERGKRNPTLVILKKIADALEVKLKDLFND